MVHRSESETSISVLNKNARELCIGKYILNNENNRGKGSQMCFFFRMNGLGLRGKWTITRVGWGGL